MAKGFLNGYKTYDTSKGFGNARKWRQSFQQRMNKEEATAILTAQPQTPLEVLGLSVDASPDAIKKAFRQLIMQWHPDKNPDRKQEAEEMSRQIIAAYSLLTT